jgi:hypothetical protein
MLQDLHAFGEQVGSSVSLNPVATPDRAEPGMAMAASPPLPVTDRG